MTDYGTIKVPREAYERHNERRKRMDLSWAAYLDGQAPDPPDVEIDRDALATTVADELEARLR